jgi:hypothetical protein
MKTIANVPDELRCKFSPQNAIDQIQQLIKKIVCHDQVGFIPGIQEWFNKYKAIRYNTSADYDHLIWRCHNETPYLYNLFIFFVVLGFELRALHFLGRHSTI